ncbi:zf-TFIIB domain-containing protein [Spirillospora sp. NPDC050679]
MHCPKCRGVMRTYTRNGVHIEQCDNCRGIFLDYGELEALSRLEAQHAPGWAAPAPPPPPAAPVQVHHHHGAPVHHHRPYHGGMFHMLFTT